MRTFVSTGLFVAIVLGGAPVSAQQWLNAGSQPKTNQSNFRPIEEWPDANEYRNAGGMPGPKYWQQLVDYQIKASLDTTTHTVTGSERVTYHNNSPDRLDFLWFQLDQNIDDTTRSRSLQAAPALPEKLSPMARRFLAPEPFDGGHKITRVQVITGTGRAAKKADAPYTIVGTEMKVMLPAPLLSGQKAVLEIDWHFIVPEASRNGRGVREKVKDGWLYEVAQWFPRASVYDDVNGWQTHQFLGQGEFYLEFGSYDVELTVPHDHIVQATGTLVNPLEVLTSTQRQRLKEAMASETPKFIISKDEVMTPGTRPPGTGDLTWKFHADSVRDFAWVSSKTYVWDAAGFRYKPDGRVIEMNSLYPRDAMPLWDSVSTKAIARTLRTYGRMAFEYPYPKVSNVHGRVGGMEYPMIAFCGVRPGPDGSYTEGMARALISVTIHEVGHNWFPMVVASDERRWTWLDEGVNSFVQLYAERDWDPDYPSARGPAKRIVDYMKDPDQVPIMTESDLIHRQFGNNGYSKPAAGLVILREQVLGPEMFDQAFSNYAKRWAFHHPEPTDFFRAMDDASGEVLNWFWRGWFYTTYANDQAVTDVTSQPADSLVGNSNRGRTYYRIKVENKGGILMPLHLAITFDDGSTQSVKLPVDVWRRNELTYLYGLFTDKTIVKVVADPDEVFADVNRENNTWSATPPPAS